MQSALTQCRCISFSKGRASALRAREPLDYALKTSTVPKMAGCIEPDMFSDDVRFWTRITRFALPEKHGASYDAVRRYARTWSKNRGGGDGRTYVPPYYAPTGA